MGTVVSIMETFELKYFLAVARNENIHRASEQLRISPGSLSKAVARLESELGVRLFHREKKTLRITAQGRVLQKQAAQIVQLEEAARVAVAGTKGSLNAVFAGSEVLLLQFAMPLVDGVQKRHPGSTFEFQIADEQSAVERIVQGDAHLAITTQNVPTGLDSKLLAQASFQTCVGEGHPLYARAKSAKAIPVEDVLLHPFVSPSHPLLGTVGAKQSLDGWRDDKFPRKVKYFASSIKLIESLVESGRAVAYLPDYLVKHLKAVPLKITGCPYSCTQKIQLVARGAKDMGWLARLF